MQFEKKIRLNSQLDNTNIKKIYRIDHIIK